MEDTKWEAKDWEGKEWRGKEEKEWRKLMKMMTADNNTIETIKSGSRVFKTSVGGSVRRILQELKQLEKQYCNSSESPSEDVKKVIKKGWLPLLVQFEKQDKRVEDNKAIFSREIQTNTNLKEVYEILLRWSPPLNETKVFFKNYHINSVISDLQGAPGSNRLRDSAQRALGGICTCLFVQAHNQSISHNQPLWYNRPLPKAKKARWIAVHWITSVLYSQLDRLIDHCNFLGESIQGHSESIVVPCSSDENLINEVKSYVHFADLKYNNTYHTAKYREHHINLSYEAVVEMRRRRHHRKRPSNKENENAKFEDFEGTSIHISVVSSKYGEKFAGPILSSQKLLTREFEDPNQYCIVATCITKDEEEVAPEGSIQREWASWTLVRRGPDNTAILIQVSVALGLQKDYQYIPYDSYSEQTFEALIKRLKEHYQDEWANDAKRTLKDLRDQRDRCHSAKSPEYFPQRSLQSSISLDMEAERSQTMEAAIVLALANKVPVKHSKGIEREGTLHSMSTSQSNGQNEATKFNTAHSKSLKHVLDAPSLPEHKDRAGSASIQCSESTEDDIEFEEAKKMLYEHSDHHQRTKRFRARSEATDVFEAVQALTRQYDDEEVFTIVIPFLAANPLHATAYLALMDAPERKQRAWLESIIQIA